LFDEVKRCEGTYLLRFGKLPSDREFGLVVATPEALSSDAGNAAATAIVEVLIDAGLIVDERQEMWERWDVDPTLADAYLICLAFRQEPTSERG